MRTLLAVLLSTLTLSAAPVPKPVRDQQSKELHDRLVRLMLEAETAEAAAREDEDKRRQILELLRVK